MFPEWSIRPSGAHTAGYIGIRAPPWWSDRVTFSQSRHAMCPCLTYPRGHLLYAAATVVYICHAEASSLKWKHHRSIQQSVIRQVCDQANLWSGKKFLIKILYFHHMFTAIASEYRSVCIMLKRYVYMFLQNKDLAPKHSHQPWTTKAQLRTSLAVLRTLLAVPA